MSGVGTLGSRLRALRMEAGHTLEDLAASSGVSVRTISDIERGRSSAPQQRTLTALETALHLDSQARRWLRGPISGSPAESVTRLAPPPLRDFSGREGAVEVTMSGLAAGPGTALVVVTGPPGVGKTSLVLEALRRCRVPNVLYVDLDGHSPAPSTPLQILQRLIRQVDLQTAPPPTLEGAVRRWYEIAEAETPVVLLDNAGAESQVRPVLGSLGVRAVFVTARRALSGLTATERIRLDPMTEREGVALLERIVPPAQRRDEDLRALSALCGGIPLALRIAGNRIASRAGTAADFVHRMRSSEKRLQLLVAGDLSVNAAFAVSYNDLAPATAHLFRSVSVGDGATFSPPMAAAAAQGMGADEAEDRLDELAELGLVEAHAGGRYRLHDLIRDYARERLDESEGRALVLDRLRAWNLVQLETNARVFRSDAGDAAAEARAGEWITTEAEHWWPAFRGAARAEHHRTVLRIASELQTFAHLWVGWGHWFELHQLALRSALALGEDRAIAWQYGMLHWAATAERGDDPEGLVYASAALEHARKVGDLRLLGWGHYHVAWASLRTGALAEALAAVLSSNGAFERVGSRADLLESLALEGTIRSALGQGAEALALLEQVKAEVEGRFSGAAGENAKAVLLESLTRAALAGAALDKAEQSAKALMVVAQRVSSDTLSARAHLNRASVRAAHGRFDAAREDLVAASRALDPHRADATAAELRSRLRELLIQTTILSTQSSEQVVAALPTDRMTPSALDPAAAW